MLAEDVLTIDVGASADGVYFARKLAVRRCGVFLYRTKTGCEVSVSADGRTLVMDVAKTDGMHITVTDMANW